MFCPPFVLNTPKFLCAGGKICENNDPNICRNPILYPNQRVTISTQYNLYCERRYLKNLAISSIYIGAVLGYLITSYLADNVGRKFACIFSWGIGSIIGFGFPFFDNIFVIIIGILITSAGVISCTGVHFSIMNEQCGLLFLKIIFILK